MTAKLDQILISADYIKSHFPKNYKPRTALIADNFYKLPQSLKFNNIISLTDIPPALQTVNRKFKGELLFARAGTKDVLIVKGRFNYYDGVTMQDISHVIYTLKYSGVNSIISIDEIGHLDPRLNAGDYCFIYDHINLMGDNPLIGPNDNNLGDRFPDMSDCYNEAILKKLCNLVVGKKIKYNEGIYLGTIGPLNETEAEARFYREIGADVVGYSVVPENIAAVHAGLKFVGIGLISRHLIADKIAEENRTDSVIEKNRQSARKKANDSLNKILIDIIKTI